MVLTELPASIQHENEKTPKQVSEETDVPVSTIYYYLKRFRKAALYFLGLLMGSIIVGGTWTMIGIGFDLW